MTMTLMNHQIKGVDHAMGQKATLVAYGIGCGKSAIGLHCLHPTKKNLIICPASLVKNWEKELKDWEIDVKQVEIKSYNKLTWEDKAHTVIFDEAHALKNRFSNRTILAEMLCEKAKKIVAMTATPILNRISEIKSIFEVMGVRLPNYQSKKLHEYLIETGLMIRVRADEVLELPKPNFSQINIELADTQEIIDLQEEIKLCYKNSDNDLDVMWKDYRMELIGKLMKIRRHVGVSKTHDAIEQIKNHIETNPDEPIIVFAHHKLVLEAIAKTYHAPLLYGKTSLTKRHKYVQEFQDGKHKVIVCSIQAAGVGLTLTKSHHVMFIEFPWVAAEYDQAYGRSYRKGQSEHVEVIDLVSSHKVDTRHQELLASKRMICDAVTDGNEMLTTDLVQKRLIESILDL